MNEEMNPTPGPEKANNAGATVLWLVLAFVPSLAAIPFINAKNPPQFTWQLLLFLAAACCLCSGFGVLRAVKSLAIRIILALLLAGVFFVLNAFIVVLVGCSTMGKIAP